LAVIWAVVVQYTTMQYLPLEMHR